MKPKEYSYSFLIYSTLYILGLGIIPLSVLKGKDFISNNNLLEATISNANDTDIISLPEFLRNENKDLIDTYKIKDTQYYYVFYDIRDSVTSIHKNFDAIGYITYFKSWVDIKHTYIDKEGNEKFLPMLRTLKRYDRVGKHQWLYIDYSKNKFINLEEQNNLVTYSDTLFSKNKNNSIKILNYYKVKEK